jgi:hypothetical protein
MLKIILMLNISVLISAFATDKIDTHVIRKDFYVNNKTVQFEGVYNKTNSFIEIKSKISNKTNCYNRVVNLQLARIHSDCWDFSFCPSTKIAWIIVLQKEIDNFPVRRVVRVFPLIKNKINNHYEFIYDINGNVSCFSVTKIINRQLYSMFKAGITLKSSSRGTLPEYSISCSNDMAVVHGSIANTYNYDLHVKLDKECDLKAEYFNFYEKDKTNEETKILLKNLSGYSIK